MAYVTDTFAKSDAAYIENIKGVDLLLHERSLPDSMPILA
jgi:ribonuclease BN (tRNA processing enzyme)